MTDRQDNTIPLVSIIVPTYHEAANLPQLVARVFTAMEQAEMSAELLIVDDDSDDGTTDVCASLAEQWPLQLITRVGVRGLSTAVIRGLREARGEILVVMDADLSHPPEAIPQLVRACQSGAADFVIGSRYVSGGAVDEGWNWFRHVNSRIATWLARGLTDAQDPMAGFFALSQETFANADHLKPLGYKIGLELIVRCGCRRTIEVPIHFRDRTLGESKLDVKQQWLYLRHLSRLYRVRYAAPVRLIQFGLVGLSGVFVDLMTFWALMPLLPLFAARATAIGTAMTSNFLINREVTFADCERTHPLRDFARFCTACLLGAVTNWSISMAAGSLHPTFAAHPLLGAAMGVIAGSLLNYALCSRWVFKEKPDPTDLGIELAISSDLGSPELPSTCVANEAA